MRRKSCRGEHFYIGFLEAGLLSIRKNFLPFFCLVRNPAELFHRSWRNPKLNFPNQRVNDESKILSLQPEPHPSFLGWPQRAQRLAGLLHGCDARVADLHNSATDRCHKDGIMIPCGGAEKMGDYACETAAFPLAYAQHQNLHAHPPDHSQS